MLASSLCTQDPITDPNNRNAPVEYDAMISYCWADMALVRSVAESLEANGFKIWIDKSSMRHDISESIITGILKSSVIIPFISDAYVDSYVCKQEIKFANDLRKPFLPVRLAHTDKVKTSTAAFITAGQLYIDLQNDVWSSETRRIDALDNLQFTLKELRSSGLEPDEPDEPGVIDITRQATVSLNLSSSPKSPALPPITTVPPDLATADPILKQLNSSGAGGNPHAQYLLALRHQFGIGTPVDLTETVFWMKLTAKNERAGHYALLHLSVLHSVGAGFPASRAAADGVDLAPREDAAVHRELAALERIDPAAPVIVARAAAWIEGRANSGSVHAQYAIGRMKLFGWGAADSSDTRNSSSSSSSSPSSSAPTPSSSAFRPNPMQAARWIMMAAEQSLPAAEAELGRLYAAGIGVLKDEAEAFRWFWRPAQEPPGIAEAQAGVGACLYSGRGVAAKNVAEAARWFRRAAEQGHAVAQNSLGGIYYRGELRGNNDDNDNGDGDGGGSELEQAAHWFRKAAAQGYAPAQRNLNAMIARGECVDE
ncbi:hypothetical protein DFJ73DRAFT_840645 [Zopfochytrium polystomum]|nr:hypothetical protein DFJ73DRAFT_840645 [Zopfochytrium polystomum]